MSNARKGIRYPKALSKLPRDEFFIEEQIAEICNVSNRTVYRWYTQGYLTRKIDNKLTTYTLNENVVPNIVINAKTNAPNRFSKTELENIYQKVMDGQIKLKPADINKAIVDEETVDTLEQTLRALEDYHELVSYVLLNKR